jgi:hypothetical protein
MVKKFDNQIFMISDRKQKDHSRIIIQPHSSLSRIPP